jgi:hypothetical protein
LTRADRRLPQAAQEVGLRPETLSKNPFVLCEDISQLVQMGAARADIVAKLILLNI